MKNMVILCNIDVYVLPKHLDEKAAALHLDKLGVKLTTLTDKQATSIGVPQQGPLKPDHCRYGSEFPALCA